MCAQARQYNRRSYKTKALLILTSFLLLSANLKIAKCQESASRKKSQELSVTASFAGSGSVSQSDSIKLHLSRGLEFREEALAIFLGTTDITSLFNSTGKVLRYSPQAPSVPPGEHKLVVYLISSGNQWKQI